ncbi:uncharacterized protein PHACADRAFT_257020 [Phanerochaete carnosa HHB-10118-sp]|uniref:Uncharacterized protein n=1 Tax=Phanerochaete carnosa (strain HHB-10118-sp) TaxID=650164 RepID=K5V0K7_PHACS|nr:uncharacterized protein PHACADRAFT_257020 [Phanerochaete carnosa HHB-10118-sp]EKM56011.1 hypothetical protein PHACADRAFT_257020 [Phanerochaete carnosa HHB-10118-sp]
MIDSLTHLKTQLNPFHIFGSPPSPRSTGGRTTPQPVRPIIEYSPSYSRATSPSNHVGFINYESRRGGAGCIGSPELRAPSSPLYQGSVTTRIDATPPWCPTIAPPPAIKSDLTCADAVRTRFMLRKILPSRVVDRILKYAECFPTISQTSGKRVVVDDDILVLSVPLTQAQCDRIMHVSLLIRGHDQGWLPVLEGGPSKNSWTWYTMCTEEKLDPDRHLVKNRAGDPNTQTYRYEWSATSDEVSKIKEGKKIEIWAHARYFGWKNVVEEAKVVIRFQPLLTSDLAR